MKFGRQLNTSTMMWEFSDGSGTAIPDELMPSVGDNISALFDAQDIVSRAASVGSRDK